MVWDYMLIQKVLKVLQQNQIDCNVSEDYLMEAMIKKMFIKSMAMILKS